LPAPIAALAGKKTPCEPKTEPDSWKRSDFVTRFRLAGRPKMLD
jgi:hypothetical protein